MDDQVHPFRSASARDAYLSWYDEQAEKWPVPAETRLAGTSFGDVFVRISGPREAPPMVLVPGDGETSLAWSLVVEALSAGFRTYCVDHLNDVGRSVPTRPVKRPADFVKCIDELLTALGLERVHLVAHSYGAWMSSLFALAHPERLLSLVLLAPPFTVLRPPVGLMVRAIAYGVLPFRFYMQRYMYWYALDCVREAETRAVVDAMVDEQLLARKCFKRRTFLIPTVLADSDWQSLRVPTLFLVGENEVSYSAREAVRRLDRVAPNVTSIIAANADHHLTLCRPGWTSDRVLEFLSVRSPSPVGLARRVDQVALKELDLRAASSVVA
jgi:pimeloyl-ACP methyl ester carboxylesterase